MTVVGFARKKYNPLFQTTQILEYVKDILQDTLHPGKQKQLKVFDKVKTLAMANLRVYC